MKANRIQFFLYLTCVSMLFAACGSEGGDKQVTEPGEVSLDDANNNAMGQSLLKIDKEIFSLPSPVQTAILLKKNAIEYNEDLLNDTQSEKRYINRFQRALNMGVYGADLAYLSNFNNTQLKLEYFKVVEKIVNDLDIRNNIDQSLIDRFAANIDKQDSLYALNAELFNAVDRYLKQNEETEVAALILTGGWIEALHLTLGVTTANVELRNRVGEQAIAAKSLISLLSRIEDPQVKELSTRMLPLVDALGRLEMTYEYVKPITDASNRITYLNSRSSVLINDAQLAEIKKAIADVRAFIIQ
jgi:hypothetical protein